MGDVVTLQRREEWVARFDLFRRPDGTHALVLVDCRMSDIENGDSVPDRMRNMAALAKVGAATMELDASKLEDGSL